MPEKETAILEDLNERQKKAIEYSKEKGSISRKEYVALTGISLRQANKDLKDLLEKKIIIRVGRGRTITYKVHD